MVMVGYLAKCKPGPEMPRFGGRIPIPIPILTWVYFSCLSRRRRIDTGLETGLAVLLSSSPCYVLSICVCSVFLPSTDSCIDPPSPPGRRLKPFGCEQGLSRGLSGVVYNRGGGMNKETAARQKQN